jgi:palmitoyltransferase
VATYFPLTFVYGLMTWSVWVVWNIGFGSHRSKHVWWAIRGLCLLGMFLYGLTNVSYTVAAFTDPGSPLGPETKTRKYSVLPTSEPSDPPSSGVQTITVSSTGAPRYCKKCCTPKPDRTHHCSTCRRCVLKMDHHCPWLSTCLGLHNYKAFVLFLVYTSLYCWVCFAASGWWMWKELFEDSGYLEELAPVNTILLSVIAGIMGLVLTGFTGWHVYLCVRGQTTIETLEKTRYLSGVRSRVERNRQERQMNDRHRRRSSEGVAERLQRAGEQILEFHANAVPGASRYEEGDEHTSPVPSAYNSSTRGGRDPSDHAGAGADGRDDAAPPADDTPALQALRRTYSNIEAQRERDRYAEYLDDQESDKMPSAFDLGWRRNLRHLLGPDPWLWWLPVCNTTGDGWRWEVSEKWLVAQEEAHQRKERRMAAVTRQQDPTRHPDARMQIRGGGHEQDHHYNQHNAVSLQPLPSQPPGRRPQRTDFDRSGPDAPAEPFQVSSSDDDDESDGDDSDSDFDLSGDPYVDVERGWQRRSRNRPRGRVWPGR